MPVRVADFAPLQVFAEWRQNIPKWAGKLWSDPPPGSSFVIASSYSVVTACISENLLKSSTDRVTGSHANILPN